MCILYIYIHTYLYIFILQRFKLIVYCKFIVKYLTIYNILFIIYCIQYLFITYDHFLNVWRNILLDIIICILIHLLAYRYNFISNFLLKFWLEIIFIYDYLKFTLYKIQNTINNYAMVSFFLNSENLEELYYYFNMKWWQIFINSYIDIFVSAIDKNVHL